jgi:hypothetical protein
MMRDRLAFYLRPTARCGAYFPDLEPPLRPPDMPTARLAVIKGGQCTEGRGGGGLR